MIRGLAWRAESIVQRPLRRDSPWRWLQAARVSAAQTKGGTEDGCSPPHPPQAAGAAGRSGLGGGGPGAWERPPLSHWSFLPGEEGGLPALLATGQTLRRRSQRCGRTGQAAQSVSRFALKLRLGAVPPRQLSWASGGSRVLEALGRVSSPGSTSPPAPSATAGAGEGSR